MNCESVYNSVWSSRLDEKCLAVDYVASSDSTLTKFKSESPSRL